MLRRHIVCTKMKLRGDTCTMKTALVILAAGIGSRYGGGVKQLEPVGPNGELIIDYSIHDAIAAGFNKIVFIIRRDIEKDFREVIGDRIGEICRKLNVEVAYAYQNVKDIPEGVYSGDRTKPWGTGHALLACREVLHEPFAVINADDYYGKEAFFRLHDYLVKSAGKPMSMCMAGFVLRNTLSENGGVTRGVCQVNKEGFLEHVTETRNLIPWQGEAGVKAADGSVSPMSADRIVSMNMWGMGPEVLPALEEGFLRFFRENATDLEKAEFLIPVFVDGLLKENRATVKMLPTADRWFGVTYKEDKPAVCQAFQKLYAENAYGSVLFGDLLAEA